MCNNINDINKDNFELSGLLTLHVPRAVTEAQLRAVLSFGVFDIVSRTMREGSDICGVFVEDDSGSYPADPVASNNVCYYGGQLNATKGDCAAKNSGDRRFCPCSQFGK